MAFQQLDIDIINSQYFFHSPLRNEQVYLFGPLVLSCWYYENHVVVNYIDGRSEQILTPFTTQMDVDYGEETKMNEEEEIPQARRDVVGGAVAGGGGSVVIDVDTDNETDEEDPLPQEQHPLPQEQHPLPQEQHPNMIEDDDETDSEDPDDDDDELIIPEPVAMN